MSETVRDIYEARDWFLKHSTGSVMCEKEDGTQQECRTFKEAREFFCSGMSP